MTGRAHCQRQVAFLTFLAISQPKMVRFLFCKKLLEGKNVLFKVIKLANTHGCLLGVVRYVLVLE